MANQGEQGTGKHAHKKVAEPYEHHGKGAELAEHTPAPRAEDEKGGRSSGKGGGEKQEAQAKGAAAKGASQGEGDAELKSREYTDAEGNVHHHTKAYMEQHKGD